MARYHPPKEWLVDFVAGQMPEGFRLVLGAHIEVCPQCRQDVQGLQKIGASFLHDLPSTELGPEACDKVWQRIQRGDTVSDTSLSVRASLQKRFREVQWHALGPVRRAKVLNTRDCHLSLLHIRAGAKMPMHTHGGNEMTLILAGAYSDCYGRYDQGDLMVADGEHRHAPIASSDEDCICLVAESAALQFTSPLMRLINPLMNWN